MKGVLQGTTDADFVHTICFCGSVTTEQSNFSDIV